MNRFFRAAGPYYILSLLAAVTYVLVYQLRMIDVNEVAASASRSGYTGALVFICVFVESFFPYFAYSPGTALIILALALAGSTVSLDLFALAWIAIMAGAVASYLQARFLRPFLARVASDTAIQRAKTAFARFGIYARFVACLHPNLAAAHFTALGLLGRPVFSDISVLGLGAVVSVTLLYIVSQAVSGPFGSHDTGTLQMLLTAGLAAVGTWAGLRAMAKPPAAT